jgi:hypothetical protein
VSAAVGHLEDVDRVYIYFLGNHGDLVPVRPLPGAEMDLRLSIMQRRRRGNQRRAPNTMVSPVSKKPPQLQIIPTISTVARYVNRASASGVTNTAITTINIVNAGGILATGANTGYPFHGFFRIKRIRLWAAPNAVTSFNQAPSVGIRWFNTVAGTLGDTNSQASDTSLSSTDVAFVDSVPPRGSAASWWSGPSTNTIFNIFAAYTTAFIMDLHLDWKLNDDANGAVASVTTTNAMTVGQCYYPPLDGVSSGNFTRIGLPNIT